MTRHTRRRFLGASLGMGALSLGAAGSLAGWWLHAADKAKEQEILESQDDSTFLTWRDDPTTTATVQWIARAPGGAAQELKCATLEAPEWQTVPVLLKPYPGTELQVHRCELVGLRPGTEYQFQRPGDAKPRRFRTMPAKATDTIQFVSGGDSGIGQHALSTNTVAAAQEPYFALIGGDLAYDNGVSPAIFLRFLQNYSRQLVDKQGRLVPMVSCVGNHEVRGGYNGKREDSPSYLSVFDGLFAERTYGVLDIGDYLSLVLLDTGHLAPIEGEQTSWLEQVLRERQERPHLLVANHVPAYPSYRAPEGADGSPGTGHGNRQHWRPLFERYNVDVVLEHHDHTFKRTHPLLDGRPDPRGVLYLGDGSWGMLRAPKSPEERPYLAAVSQAYHMTVHRLEGQQRFHVALEDTGRVADVCMTSGKRASASKVRASES